MEINYYKVICTIIFDEDDEEIHRFSRNFENREDAEVWMRDQKNLLLGCDFKREQLTFEIIPEKFMMMDKK